MEKKTPKWESELRMHLAAMCMAAVAGKEGDLREATDAIIEWVDDNAARVMYG